MRRLVVLLLLLSSCSDTEPVVIDGSSAETFKKTSWQARRQIPDRDRLIFDRALRTVGGRQHSRNDPDTLARITFDGMTAEQIVEDQKLRDGG